MRNNPISLHLKNMTNGDTTEVYKIWHTSIKNCCFHFPLMLHFGDIKCGGKFQVSNRSYFIMLQRASQSADTLPRKIMLCWLKKQSYKLREENPLRAIKFKEATIGSVSLWVQTSGRWDILPKEYYYILCWTF